MHAARADELPFRDLPGRLSADPLAGVDAGELSVRFARVRAGSRSPHRHPRSVEVIYVVEGEGVHWQAGETLRVRPGDVVLVPAGVPHATVADAGGELLLYCVFPVADLAGNVEELEGEISL